MTLPASERAFKGSMATRSEEIEVLQVWNAKEEGFTGDVKLAQG
jgi:hypothetical protein